MARRSGRSSKGRSKSSSGRKSSPRKSSPRKSSPRKSSPRKASPRKASPRKASPRRTSTPTSRPTPKPTTRPQPRKVSTNNPQVASQNNKRPSPTTPSTNNPQVASQNNPRPTNIYTTPTSPLYNPNYRPPPPIRLPTGTLLSIKSPQNPNQNPYVSTFESLTIDVSGDKIKPQFQKEIQQHLSGEKQIDPQRLSAIQEGRIVVTEGIKTTFVPTDQQVRILQAMEKQKQQEKEVKKQHETTYTFNGKDVTQQTLTAVEKQRKEREIQNQKSIEMRNRSNEEILKNFIKVQTQKEQQGLSPDTNLNKYLTERGYDISKPETIPTTVFQPTKLDTAQKMLDAGLNPSIVNMRLQSMGLPLIENPNNLNTGLIIDTNVPPIQKVNYTGLHDDRIYDGGLQPPKTQTVRNDFVPPVQQNTNKPVGVEIKSVSTTGLSSVPQVSSTQVIASGTGKVESAVHQLPIPLLAGILFLGT